MVHTKAVSEAQTAATALTTAENAKNLKEQELKTIEAEIGKLEKLIKDANTNKTVADRKLGEAQHALSEPQQTKEDAEQKVRDLTPKLERLNRELTELKSKILPGSAAFLDDSATQQAIQAANKLIDDLNKELKTAKNAYTTSKTVADQVVVPPQPDAAAKAEAWEAYTEKKDELEEATDENRASLQGEVDRLKKTFDDEKEKFDRETLEYNRLHALYQLRKKEESLAKAEHDSLKLLVDALLPAADARKRKESDFSEAQKKEDGPTKPDDIEAARIALQQAVKHEAVTLAAQNFSRLSSLHQTFDDAVGKLDTVKRDFAKIISPIRERVKALETEVLTSEGEAKTAKQTELENLRETLKELETVETAIDNRLREATTRRDKLATQKEDAEQTRTDTTDTELKAEIAVRLKQLEINATTREKSTADKTLQDAKGPYEEASQAVNAARSEVNRLDTLINTTPEEIQRKEDAKRNLKAEVDRLVRVYEEKKRAKAEADAKLKKAKEQLDVADRRKKAAEQALMPEGREVPPQMMQKEKIILTDKNAAKAKTSAARHFEFMFTPLVLLSLMVS